MCIIYLAIPYSVWDAEKSFDVANQVAAKLMQEGNVVFSPISHSHPIQQHVDKKNWNHDFWMKQDLPILKICDRITFVVIKSYNGEDVQGEEMLRNSFGCKEELMYATLLNKEISFVTHKS